MEKEIIVLPNHLYNPIFVSGLSQPLEAVAEILDEQNRPEHALALRDAKTICEVFSKVILEKSAELFVPEKTAC